MDGRILATSGHLRPLKGQILVFLRSIRPLGRFFTPRGIKTVRLFACDRFPQGQDESAGFPGYNARDILESFTGEKLLPS